MKYTKMTVKDQESLFAKLASMPDFVQSILGRLSSQDAVIPGPDGSLSPVEQCWHLADLEREAYAVRIQRLVHEADPALPDFDGGRIAKERNYKSLSLTDGIRAFRDARSANMQVLRSLSDSDWFRSGSQEGVGPVALCDIPSMMAQHDDAHRREIEVLLRERS
jgi:hypothetical protein